MKSLALETESSHLACIYLLQIRKMIGLAVTVVSERAPSCVQDISLNTLCSFPTPSERIIALAAV
eukprot:COSAG02_NODE_28906_length_580_cov_0.523909_2_plen_64_part_01